NATYSGDANYPGPVTSTCETFTVIKVSTKLTKAAAASTTVTYTYAEMNDGSVALNPPVAGNRNSLVTDPDCVANGGTVTFTGGDTANPGVLDPGETWTFTCTVTKSGSFDLINTATGHGIDPLGLDVTFCTNPTTPPSRVRCDQDERGKKEGKVYVSITTPAPG